MIQIQPTIIPDCVVLKPDIYRDERGIFTEIYKGSILSKFKPVQSNCSISKLGVLRGIHRTPYAKLVTCVKGKIYDVCVDLRSDSNTYKQAFGIELNSSNLMSLYIPPYCGHGFLAMEDSVVIYHQNQEYHPSLDETYCYKNYNVSWPIVPSIISDKDAKCCI
jgi:dTDP-4-dehydrorhamnose 3,5-epimerase